MKKLLLSIALVLGFACNASAQITAPYVFTANTTILSARVNANFAMLADALNRTGGTMTGTLTSQTIVPASHNTYNLGSTGSRFAVIYGVTEILTTSLTLGANVFTVASSNVQIDSKYINLAGRQSVWVPASALAPTVTTGATGLITSELTAGNPNITYMSFTNGSTTYAQFSVALPKSWNASTVTFQPYWTGTSAGAGTTIWGLQCVASEDNETIDATFGTAQEVTDTFLTVRFNHVGPESSAITVAGAADDAYLTCQVYRKGASDTRAAASFLLGLKLFITTDAPNDL